MKEKTRMTFLVERYEITVYQFYTVLVSNTTSGPVSILPLGEPPATRPEASQELRRLASPFFTPAEATAFGWPSHMGESMSVMLVGHGWSIVEGIGRDWFHDSTSVDH